MILLVAALGATLLATAFVVDRLFAILLAIAFLIALWIYLQAQVAIATGRIRVLVLLVGLLALVSLVFLTPSNLSAWFNAVAVPLGVHLGIALPHIDLVQPSPFVFVSVLVAIVAIAALVAWMPEKRITPFIGFERATPDDSRQYQEELALFAQTWAHRLDLIDRETNWNDRRYVPLEAEVEVQMFGGRAPRFSELTIELRREPGLVLLLGEPGSGKSVALRRLCRTLLAETPTNGCLPLYVNLSRWSAPPGGWSEASPPTGQHLRDYVFEYVSRVVDDINTDRFLRANFEEMLAKGAFYFIFDSFDEIPAIMDAVEHSWITDALSDVLGRFLAGFHHSTGIVASRFFKRPSDKLGQAAIYRIKPFDDDRIVEALHRSGIHSDAKITELFSLRPDLVDAASTPLVAGLLSAYLQAHDGALPPNKVSLYLNFITRQLNNEGTKQRINEAGLTVETLFDMTVGIASDMYTMSEYGLDVPASRLRKKGRSAAKLERVLGILKFARLGRLSSSAPSTFSFSHRRIHEFFVVVAMLRAETGPDPTSAIADNRYRDVLVLYCEVASAANANEIASHCWSQISRAPHWRNTHNAEVVESIQALRFLTDAFRARRADFTPTFQDELATFLGEALGRSNRPLLAKFASEAIALLEDERAAPLFSKALDYPSGRVRETAFRACRHIGSVSPSMLASAEWLIRYFRYMPITGSRLITNGRTLMFSLGVSDGFKPLRRVVAAWLADTFVFWGSALALLFAAPLLGGCLLLSIYIFDSLLSGPNVMVKEAVRTRRGGVLFIFALLCFITMAIFTGVSWVISSVPSDTAPDFAKLVLAPWDLVLVAAGQPVLLWGYRALILGSIVGLFPIVPSLVGRRKPRLRRTASTVRRREAARPSPQVIAENAREAVRQISALEPSFWTGLGKAILVITGFALAIYAIWLWGGVRTLVFIALAAVIVTLAVLVGLWLIRYAQHKAKDSRVLLSLELAARIDRRQVERTLRELNLQSSRLRYLGILGQRHVVAEGHWEDRFPFEPNDPASDELLRLEERWLKLER